ncbi:MAG TPA: T9SS type A sorting domain-containing protein [Chitinophagaceae bacterium]|nr:T9SS type A sorting domain-containing protein [Chitinophagaceae bacterium]
MKKTLFICFMLGATFTSRAANPMLKSAVKGDLKNDRIAAMALASNGTYVTLLLADKTSLYAVDIEDTIAKEKVPNAITSIPDFVNSKLKPVAGGATLTVIDIEVNPISKSVYVLAQAAGVSYVFKVRNNGANVTLIDLKNITHSKLAWGGTFDVNDMTYGNGNLYASSGNSTLDGSVATIPSPFTNGGAVTKKATTMFKSNWGGAYSTKAPLETMTYGLVKSKHRLMGVTTCAPGFSLDITGLSGAGTTQVTEDFNVQFGFSQKVVFQRHDGKDWLFDLHDSKLYRLGETLLDGSPVTAGQFNSDAVELRDFSGIPKAGIPADIFKEMTPGAGYQTIAYWDEFRLVVLESGGTLKMLQTATKATPLSVDKVQPTTTLRVYPNPAQQTLNVNLSHTGETTLQVFSMDGRLVHTSKANSAAATIDVSSFAKGQYVLKAWSEEGVAGEQIFSVQ